MEEVLGHISQELSEKESKRLLRNLQIDDDLQKEFSEKLEDIPWLDVKMELEMMGKDKIIDYIQKKTLITKGTAFLIDFMRANIYLHYVMFPRKLFFLVR